MEEIERVSSEIEEQLTWKEVANLGICPLEKVALVPDREIPTITDSKTVVFSVMYDQGTKQGEIEVTYSVLEDGNLTYQYRQISETNEQRVKQAYMESDWSTVYDSYPIDLDIREDVERVLEPLNPKYDCGDGSEGYLMFDTDRREIVCSIVIEEGIEAGLERGQYSVDINFSDYLQDGKEGADD